LSKSRTKVNKEVEVHCIVRLPLIDTFYMFHVAYDFNGTSTKLANFCIEIVTLYVLSTTFANSTTIVWGCFKRDEYLVMSFSTSQTIPHGYGSAIHERCKTHLYNEQRWNDFES